MEEDDAVREQAATPQEGADYEPMEEWRPRPITRRPCRQVLVGGIPIGGGAPITVQSMTCTDTMDVEATSGQIAALCEAGADLVRVSVPTLEAVEPFGRICARAPCPIVADIHFDHRIAIAAAEHGAAALRINPGNIGSRRKVAEVCHAASDHNLPIRVGVNSGSLDRDLLRKYGSPTPDAMVEAALRSAEQLEEHGFRDYLFSVKASELFLCVEAYERLARQTDAPLHLGITEAGGLTGGTVLSSIGIGMLLQQGIGDTLRVSLAADPVEEIRVGWAILKSMHLRVRGVDITACPTCARQGIDVINTVRELEERLGDIREPLHLAVMGCVVNGPGEALTADIAVCGVAGGQCMVYEDGRVQGKVPADSVLSVLESRVRQRLASRQEGEVTEIKVKHG